LCVTGTSGALGSSVLRHLLETLHYPPSNLIISSSHPSSVPASLTSMGVVVRYGDYLDQSTLAAAYSGITKLLIVSFPSMGDESRFVAHRNAIDAAKGAGVQHLYYTSLAFNGQPSLSPIMFAHSKTEKYLKSMDMTYTILRESLYNGHSPFYCGLLDPQRAVANEPGAREILSPTAGEIAFAAIDDLGEATARIVAHSGPDYDDRICLLSGPVAVSMAEVVAMISAAL
ncbi:NAD(P)-binding protein, partial [Cadophora sp. DSE1049]